MATIDKIHSTLVVRGGAGAPTVTAAAGPPVSFAFKSPTITATASVRLTGTARESVAGWIVGFIQLKYIGTNYARYRGLKDSQGSILESGSNQILCRDTDIGSTEVWYDSVNSGGKLGPTGTNVLPAGSTIPATGFLDVPAGLHDRPSRWFRTSHVNSAASGRPLNFLHHADAGLAFCTILTVRDAANKFHLLKHFYWNVRWEQMFVATAPATVVTGRMIHMQHNIQTVQNGVALDSKFHGKELDLSLPVSNTVSRRPHHMHSATDWRLM